MPQTIDHWIGGKTSAPVDGVYFEDLNPLDDSLYATVARGSPADVDRAVTNANEAFETYRSTTAKDRERTLCRAADLLESQSNEFLELLVDEIGSPIRKAQFELSLAVGLFRAAAGMARQASGKTLPSDVPNRLSLSVRTPLGVIAAITPFNVPLIKGVRLTANALALGNTVVLLPSEEAPVIAHRLALLYAEAGLPPGALNIVNGVGAEIGDTLTTHSLVRFVSFTGSTRVGRHIATLCGERMRRHTLELGGKSPLVVLADADIERAVAAAVHGIFTYQGQVCMGSSRVFVERPVYDTFLERFVRAANGLSLGPLRDPKTVIGPIINVRQRTRVREHIEDALSGGATALCGGGWQGNRCEPTILTHVQGHMRCFAEETFGPVVAVYPVDSVDDALVSANASTYGLSSSVFTADIQKALKFANSVHSGMVHVNGTSLHDEPHVPFGGVGDSGFGREGTEEDIVNMTEWKWITLSS